MFALWWHVSVISAAEESSAFLTTSRSNRTRRGLKERPSSVECSAEETVGAAGADDSH